jgi:hypothetical protein
MAPGQNFFNPFSGFKQNSPAFSAGAGEGLKGFAKGCKQLRFF